MSTYQAVGIGNAVVDVISQCEDAFLQEMGIEKGVMTLIDQDRAEALYAAMQNRTQAPGGSVANTVAGMGALGLTTGFIGRVNDDALGRYYAKAMSDVGSHFVNAPVPGGEQTSSRSMIFVSPDGERSMNTYLGISTELGPEDVDDSVAGECDLLLLEGYLYDKPRGKAAFTEAARICREAGGLAGISLSDPFCVDRHRSDFRALLRELDYVIGNDHEWRALYQTEDLDAALTQASRDTRLVVCTRSGDAVTIHRSEDVTEVPVTPIKPLDTTGAGDQFAAGFLFGLVSGVPMAVAGRMGCIAAAEVITHYGARPEADVLEMFRAEGLV